MRWSVVSACFALATFRIEACSCLAAGSPCLAAGTSAAVFIGTVEDLAENANVSAPADLNRPSTSGRNAAFSRRTREETRLPVRPYRSVRMLVLEIFSGVPAGTPQMTVLTGFGDSDCGVPFQRGVSYVVYAFRNTDGQLVASLCSRTRELSAAAEDLEYFRRNANGPETSRIRVITGVPGSRGRAKESIRLEHEDAQYTSETGLDGVAEFTAVPAGDYVVRAEADGKTPDDPRISVYAKGCVDVTLLRSLRIKGRILTGSSVPAQRIEVQARSPDGSPAGSTMTGPDGSYELRIFMPGQYHIGINLNHSPTRETPYPRWFHPGTSDPAAATVLAFSGKPESRSINFEVPATQDTRVIEGTVLKPDGQPAPVVRLSVFDDTQTLIAYGDADPDGRFRLTVFAGTTYHLHAVWPGNLAAEAASAVPVLIQSGRQSVSLRLVLTEPTNSTLNLRR